MQAITQHLRVFPHKNRTAIDVGSYTGDSVLQFSQVFKHVYGYEPSNRSFGELAKNTASIKNIEVYNLGICDQECFGTMHGGHASQFHFKPDKYGKILCKTLDQECSEKKDRKRRFFEHRRKWVRVFRFERRNPDNFSMETSYTIQLE